MRPLSATAAIAFVLAASLSLAQADDPHAGASSGGNGSRAGCEADAAAIRQDLPHDGQDEGRHERSTMPGNMSGRSEQDMKAMHEMMKKCMDAKGKDGDGTDQHQH